MNSPGNRGSVVVFGSLNLDTTFEVAHIPEPGETILSTGRHDGHGGKGANQAMAAARIGAATAMVGAIGSDAGGAGMVAALDEAGVDVSGVRVDVAPTGQALIAVDASGENTIIVSPGANGTLADADATTAVELLAAGDVLVLQLETPIAATLAAALGARERGARVLLNAAPSGPCTAELVAATDVLVCNETEIADVGVLLGMSAHAHRDAAVDACLAAGARAVVVTLGAEGATITDTSGTVTVPAYHVTPVDTVGAGDCFTGVLAASLAEGSDLVTSARRASAAAALAVQRPGAQESMPTLAEVLAFEEDAGDASQ